MTKNEIINLFKKLNLKPVQSCFITKEDKQLCGCLMTALYIKDNGVPRLSQNVVEKINDWATKKFGDKTWDMIAAFDFPNNGRSYPSIRAAAKQLFAE